VQLETLVNFNVSEHFPLESANLDGTSTVISINNLPVYAVTKPHYLGPTIVAEKNRPVRIKFYNLLPSGAGGNLFIPVDTTVMGSGMTAQGHTAMEMMDPMMIDPQNPMCNEGGEMKAQLVADGLCYAENRATLHLHGGISPWISDGTPHQWITPADQTTPYPQGVSVSPVPDMGDSGNPNDGVMTFYYTNQQSARLMFYHDHAWGITRLNVYAGEAAPYIITDATEQSLLSQGLIPGAESTIPLVIQDKTFVPAKAQLAAQDETWDMDRWGGPGNLWLPHVYSPAQNPGDASGVNQFGRWAYGPWFWPPTLSVEHGPVPNPYYDPVCNPDVEWCEPPLMPGVPYNSMGMEAFMDTPVVNGAVYPSLTVEPKSYRFRILNAANDRFFNLSIYKAVDANGNPCDPANSTPAPESTGVTCTEVMLNPDEVAAALLDPTIFPTPVAGTEGPNWIQIGTEGGFLPAPAVIPAHPTTWVNDPTVFNAGNVDQHSLLIGPAERADVIVDFSAFAGQTLILYNDAPAAFPARDPRYDYYTGNGDYTETGGAPSTLPGYGPNTRTVMQIKVAAATPAPAFNLTALESAFMAASLGGLGIFESGQHPIIVGQGEYNSAYGTSFPINGPENGTVQIFDTSLTFKTLLGDTLTMPLQPKQIQDEMGEAFDPEYGRMSGFLGLETPNAQAGMQNMLLYGFVMPPTEVLKGIELPAGVELSPIASTDDGSQIWKITHNGVDTHPIHFHLYDVQLINRVGWDGIIRKPDPNELGWKDTVRISPLEDTIVALRPLVPSVPWDLPNSVRLLDPSMPEGSLLGMGMVTFDPSGEPVQVYNRYINFGWEYVWHCHILSHEEMDMMRPVVVAVAPRAPSSLVATVVGNGNNKRVDLIWQDNSLNETQFTVQRAASSSGPWTILATLPSEVTTYTDPIGNTNQTFAYRVIASNTVGDTDEYPAPSIGFPVVTKDSPPSNTVTVGTVQLLPPSAPSNLTATFQSGPQILLSWTDKANNETGFVIERSVGAGAFTSLITVGPRNNTGSVSYTDTNVSAGTVYSYRVAAVNLAGLSAYTNTATASIPAPPAAPSPVTATAVRQGNSARVTLIWTNVADETGYTIERATNSAFTANVVTSTVGANTTTFTTGNVPRNAFFYFRVRAFNGAGVSAWANATPFPIRTP
jgi:FtsP/CotA-like multicopper oxidase with cupredoxin domain